MAWYLTSCIAEIPVSPTKYELRNYAREEFERHRNVTDLVSLARSVMLLELCGLILL